MTGVQTCALPIWGPFSIGRWLGPVLNWLWGLSNLDPVLKSHRDKFSTRPNYDRYKQPVTNETFSGSVSRETLGPECITKKRAEIFHDLDPFFHMKKPFSVWNSHEIAWILEELYQEVGLLESFLYGTFSYLVLMFLLCTQFTAIPAVFKCFSLFHRIECFNVSPIAPVFCESFGP